MFGSLGLPEILVILVLALLIFGPKRLPEVGRTIGKGLAEFRRATTDLKRSVNAELSLEEDERPPTTRRPVQGVGRTVAEASATLELPVTGSVDSAPATEPSPAAPADTTPRTPETAAPADPSADAAEPPADAAEPPADAAEPPAADADPPAADAEPPADAAEAPATSSSTRSAD